MTLRAGEVFANRFEIDRAAGLCVTNARWHYRTIHRQNPALSFHAIYRCRRGSRLGALHVDRCLA
jgi:hypothetical protein